MVIDVREEWEYKRRHVSGAINIPVYRLIADVPSTIPQKDTPIYLYCDHGVKSRAGKVMLEDLGYTNVRVMNGSRN